MALSKVTTMPQDDFLAEKEERIRQRIQRAATDVWEIGKDLLEVKEALPHGQFGKWLQEKFGWGHQTANNFMNVAKSFPEIPNDLEISHRALYALAAPKVPQSARKEALEVAKKNQGERLSDRQVEGIVGVYAAVNSEPVEDKKSYHYQGKRVYGRLGEGNENFGWLEPGTEVHIASASLTDRSQRFVRLVDEPCSVFQVALNDLVEQFALDVSAVTVTDPPTGGSEFFREMVAEPIKPIPAPSPRLAVGDVVCFCRSVDDLVAELDNGTLLPSIDRGKIVKIEGHWATVNWIDRGERESGLDLLAKLPARYQENVAVEVPEEEESELVLACREVLGQGMKIDPDYYPPEPICCAVGVRDELPEADWNRFFIARNDSRIAGAICSLSLSSPLSKGSKGHLFFRADAICLDADSNALYLYFGKDSARFRIEFYSLGAFFLSPGRQV